MLTAIPHHFSWLDPTTDDMAHDKRATTWPNDPLQCAAAGN